MKTIHKLDLKFQKGFEHLHCFTVDLEDYDCNEIYEGFEEAVKEALKDTSVINYDVSFDTLDNGEPFATVSNWSKWSAI